MNAQLWPTRCSTVSKNRSNQFKRRDGEVARRMRDLKARKSATVPWEELHQELLAMQIQN
jgi:hypothetical protein